MPAEKAIAAIPLSIIRPFLNESRVITEEQAEHCPEIVALDEDHIVIGAGDLFYVRGLRSHNNQEIFDVFRPNKTYRDPDTQALLGIEGLMLGKAQIQKPGALAQWVVRKSFAEIRVGDKVMETEKETIMPFFMPQYPKGKAQGKIISVFGGISQVSQYQVVVITGGHDQQRQAGDVLGAKQTEKDIPRRLWVDGQSAHGFPPLKIGTLIVFRVFDKVSYALVMNAIRPIYLLDAVGTP
jgi:hypothetical protein